MHVSARQGSASIPRHSGLQLSSLRAFGEEAERLGRPSIDVGGFLVPGPEPGPSCNPGKENQGDERPAGEGQEAGSAAGPRQRPQAEAAATGAAAHALGLLTANWRGNDITAAELEELDYWYPDVRAVSSSSRSVYLGLTAGLFRDLPFRARLVAELPRPEFAAMCRPLVRVADPAAPTSPGSIRWRSPSFQLVRPVPLVPSVRVWAMWEGGPAHGTLIVSHHRQPDYSICACMPHQWIRGVHPLVDYVGMCVSWVAKVAHEREIGFYPGPQHYPEWTRIERDRPREYCGCGSHRRYGDCHRSTDRALSLQTLRERRGATHHEYFADLMRQMRPTRPPRTVLAAALQSL